MIRESPVESVITAGVVRLRANATVTALASGGVHNNVPQGTGYPYVEVTSPTDRRVDTMRRFGAESLLMVKAVSQGRGDQEGARLLNACVVALSGHGGSNTLTLTAPHTSLGITWEHNDRYSEVINGVTTRYHVGMFRVWTEQTS